MQPGGAERAGQRQAGSRAQQPPPPLSQPGSRTPQPADPPPPSPREGKAKAEQRTSEPESLLQCGAPRSRTHAPSALLAATAQACERRGGQGKQGCSTRPQQEPSRTSASPWQAMPPPLPPGKLLRPREGTSPRRRLPPAWRSGQPAVGKQAGFGQEARGGGPQPVPSCSRLALPLRLPREGRRQRRIGSAPRLPSCPPPPRPRLGIPTGKGREGGRRRSSRCALPPGEGAAPAELSADAQRRSASWGGHRRRVPATALLLTASPLPALRPTV